MWTDERDLIMDIFDDSNEKFPRACPCCGTRDGHVFYFKNAENERLGSAWAWCGTCKEFSHSRNEIPDWWKNFYRLDLS